MKELCQFFYPGGNRLPDIPRGWAARGSPVQEETVSRAVVLVKNPKKGYAATKMLDFRHGVQTPDIRLLQKEKTIQGEMISLNVALFWLTCENFPGV